MTFLYLIAAKNSREKGIPKPARIPPQTPPAGGKSAEAKRKILFHRKTDFRFAESVLKPRHTARILGGQNPKKKNVLSFFRKNRARANPKCQDHFFFLGLSSEARRWRGFRGAYDSIQSHHALRAWHISGFGNGFELGTINTPHMTLHPSSIHFFWASITYSIIFRRIK